MVRRLLSRFAVAHADELRVHVMRSPLAAIGVAFAAGLAAGSSGYTSRLVKRESFEAALAIVGSMLFATARDAVMRSAREWMQQRTVH
jgi:hypothetical protein